jgi:hypothetical protein
LLGFDVGSPAGVPLTIYELIFLAAIIVDGITLVVALMTGTRSSQA